VPCGPAEPSLIFYLGCLGSVWDDEACVWEPWIDTVKRPGPLSPSSHLIVSHRVPRVPSTQHRPQYELPRRLFGSNVNLLHPISVTPNSHTSLSFPSPFTSPQIRSGWRFLQPLSIKHDTLGDAVAFTTVDWILDQPSSSPHNATRTDLLIWILWRRMCTSPRTERRKLRNQCPPQFLSV